MPFHHTKDTVAVTAWCDTCGKATLHRVSGKRIGHCLVHEPAGMSKAQEARRKKREQEELSPKFEI